MRIKVTIDAKNLTIPRNYLHILQGIIYHSLPSEFATFTHEKEDFKLFNFSLIHGDFISNKIPNSNENIITFLDKASFYISSIDQNFIIFLCNQLAQNKYIRFGNYLAPIIDIEDCQPKIKNNKIDIVCLSPVTIHKTVDGKTKYYNPLDNEFFDLINENFAKKININDNHLLNFSNVRNITKIVSKYKNFIIESYKFSCTIEGKNEHLEMLYSLGLGDRNSYGFGMFETV